MSVKELRSRTAEHMRSHADDFLPFLTNPNTGDMYTTGNTFIFVSFVIDMTVLKNTNGGRRCSI